MITGRQDLGEALSAYFGQYREIFRYNEKKGELTLVHDYVSKSFREEMRPHLNDEKGLFSPRPKTKVRPYESRLVE